MNARYLLGIALAAAAAVAACGGGDDGSILSSRNTPRTPAGDTDPDTDTTNTPPPPPGTGTTPSGTVPTNSEEGKKDFEANVFPFLNTKCSGCHATGGIGNPAFMKSGDAIGTYALIYTNGFAVDNSRVLVKGPHSGGAAPALDATERTKWMNWLAKEQASSGTKPTQQNVLEKFGTCFDEAKFNAIGLNQLRTTRRQNGNNPQNLNENANQCTGCDNAPCGDCHTGGAASTGFILALVGANTPAGYTFEQTKKLSPPFIRQWVATDATGAPVLNPGLKNKSINTVEKAKAYTHPMYRVPAAMDQAIQAFVQDAVDKYKAGTCGK